MDFIKKVWNSKYFCIAMFVVYFTVPFVLYASLFQQNLAFLSGDGLQYFNGRQFVNSSIHSGDFSLWNPYLTNGKPYAGDLMGVLYPASLMGIFLPLKCLCIAIMRFTSRLAALLCSFI
jgi:hypothetical protein